MPGNFGQSDVMLIWSRRRNPSHEGPFKLGNYHRPLLETNPSHPGENSGALNVPQAGSIPSLKLGTSFAGVRLPGGGVSPAFAFSISTD
jgi:hypothetical protein